MAALALMYAFQEPEPLVLLHAALEDSSDTALDELFVDDGVGVRPALDLHGDDFLIRELLAQDESEDLLRPRRRGYRSRCRLYC